VIFDLDDTLYPREQFVRGGLAAVAAAVEREHAVPGDAALAAMQAAPDPRTAFDVLHESFGVPRGGSANLLEVFRTHPPCLSLFGDAVAAIIALRRAGWLLALLTNGLPRVQRHKVAALGVADLVDCVVYAEEHASGGKPGLAAFERVLRLLEVSSLRCVMVGDDAHCDVFGGQRAGMRTIWMPRPGAVIAEAVPDVTLHRLADVPAAAESLVRGVGAHAA
jgi:putative hydrolase of the HAD superfamily